MLTAALYSSTNNTNKHRTMQLPVTMHDLNNNNSNKVINT